MKKIISLLIIIILSSCKSKKVITDNKPIDFIPNSSKLRFKLSEKEKMPYPSYDFGAEVYKDKIYAFLGTEDHLVDWNKSYGKVCEYDIKKNKWEVINTLPKYQSMATSVIIKDKIYLIGGYGWSNLIQVYNITQNQWEDSIQIPIGLYWTTVETYNESIYIIGGYAKKGEKDTKLLDDVQIYNTKNKKWTSGEKSPRPMHSPNSLKLKDEFYVWDSYYHVFFKYNPMENKWYNLEKMRPFVKGSQEGVAYNQKLLFVGGHDINYENRTSKTSRKLYLYDNKKSEYIESSNDLLKERIYNFKVFNYKDDIYVLGGRSTKKGENHAMNNVVKLEIN